MIGTPSYDGRVDSWFADGLIETIRESFKQNIFIKPVYVCYDSLVQRARNTLVDIAINSNYDDLIFLDSDIEFKPEWIFKLLNYPEPIVGAALVKKGDTESYTVKILDKNLKYNSRNDLVEVDGLGTGFLKVNKFAFEQIWNMSAEYKNEETVSRMVFNIEVKDGILISEDYVFCNKWKELGYKVWMDPSFTINHIGNKKYTGDIKSFMEKIGYK